MVASWYIRGDPRKGLKCACIRWLGERHCFWEKRIQRKGDTPFGNQIIKEKETKEFEALKLEDMQSFPLPSPNNNRKKKYT